ncbi:MAG: 3-deoxy-D-manno-octulosonic acid kinase [Gammaproteobacteria bacterium]|nr:3-deoxy-D-manno-octulosonic acid kinase [Gammaproteobacteria bacterium]
MIKAERKALQNGIIVYDAAQADKIHEHVFTPSYWTAREALGEPLGGRGAAWRIQDGDIDWVLRQYRRGGLVGRVVLDWYFYAGLERTRPFHEWYITARLHDEGLPVPRPVAARVDRGLIGYRGALITATVPGTSFASMLESAGEATWRAIGRTVRRLHDAGAWHADLNAHNILVEGDSVTVIDWDRGQVRPQDTAWREANLKRLRRSLDKLRPEDPAMDAGWRALRDAYNG